MIIFKTNGIVFCILDNPKCGSSTLREWYDKTLIKTTHILFLSSDNFNHGNYAYSNYKHCNLEGAVKFLETRKDIDINKVVFITTIRNPIEKCLSAYFYSLNYSKVKFFDTNSTSVEEDFDKFILGEPHMHQFYPEKFRMFNNYKIHTIKVESMYDDFISLFKLYNVCINCDILKAVTNQTARTKNINISNKTLDFIKDKFKLDYIDGNY